MTNNQGTPGNRDNKNQARRRFAELKRKRKNAGKRRAKERKKREGS